MRQPARIIILAGGLLLAALLPLLRYSSLIGENVTPFLLCFCAAGLAYVLALARLPRENPGMRWVWGFALAFRLVLLLTPVSLSEDVYRYIWDGHLMTAGANPYFAPVNSPLLDPYATALRARVNFPWMATPYLPAAQAYFTLVEKLAPQNPFAFQLGAAVLDLAAGGLVLLALRRLSIPDKAVLVYLWNPLVVVEFAHGAHIDALMVFFVAAALWGMLHAGRGGRTLSALTLAGGVLVKGWPALIAPLLAVHWGFWRTGLFVVCVVLPLALFAAGAGWGLGGELDGSGVFGALRIYSQDWEFNSGLYYWLAHLLSAPAARTLALVLPALLGLGLGWQAMREETQHEAARAVDAHNAMPNQPAATSGRIDPADGRRLVRRAILPFGLFLLLAPTVHPWYLTLVWALLPFCWPAPGEDHAARRWIWPWVYFMFFEGFTYLAYSGLSEPGGLALIRTAAYLPLWGLLGWAGWRRASHSA